jgi:3-hydroxyisobutyrate dehydrogenase
MAGAAQDRKAVGFIGVGNMGWPQAANLARGGYPVVAFDADPARAERFAGELGTKWARTLAELGAAVDTVVTMLPTGQIVRSVMLDMEGGGLVRALRPGALLIDMSSSDPIGTRELGEILAKRGVALVDAPVSGGTRGAQEGTLTIMIGGDDRAAIERAKPILETMGKRLFETGPLGSGHAMKALNNYVAATGFAAASEALIVGERFGLDPKVMVDIMNVSTGRNFSTENTIKGQVLPRTFASGFALGLMAKDVKIAADLARGLDMEAPIVQLASARLGEAARAVGGEKDHTVAFKFWAEQLAKASGKS